MISNFFSIEDLHNLTAELDLLYLHELDTHFMPDVSREIPPDDYRSLFKIADTLHTMYAVAKSKENTDEDDEFAALVRERLKGVEE